MKYFLKKLMGHEIFMSMVSWTTKLFLKNLKIFLKNSPAHSHAHAHSHVFHFVINRCFDYD